LVHLSQLANRFVRSPHDLVAVGDVVTVWVLKVDSERRRVSLTMIEPGSQRQAPQHPPRRRHRGGDGDRVQQPAQQQGADGSAESHEQATQQRRDHRGERRQHGGQQQYQGRRPKGRQQDRASESAGGGGHKGHSERKRTGGRKQAPVVKLSQEALEGRAVLHTFGELKALFEHKKKPGGGNTGQAENK
ncbi:MAG: S1 RNA-binding domain-containing protein, partial [Planctomycetota bacterium]